jgi:AcrR family transcriptional regulator
VREFVYGRFSKNELLGKRAMKTRESLYQSCEALIKLGVKYRDITPRKVVAGTELSSATFYQYWGSVDELIDEIYLDWMGDNRVCGPHLWAMVNLIRKER